MYETCSLMTMKIMVTHSTNDRTVLKMATFQPPRSTFLSLI